MAARSKETFHMPQSLLLPINHFSPAICGLQKMQSLDLTLPMDVDLVSLDHYPSHELH
jgi:hypothetical protein